MDLRKNYQDLVIKIIKYSIWDITKSKKWIDRKTAYIFLKSSYCEMLLDFTDNIHLIPQVKRLLEEYEKNEIANDTDI